jgi:hypothetical protein
MGQFVELVERHTPENAAPQRARLVGRKIHLADGPYQDEDLAKFVVFLDELRFVRRHRRMHYETRVIILELDQFLGDVLRRQHEVRNARHDGGTGHAAELGGLFVLYQRDAALGLDRLEPHDAV